MENVKRLIKMFLIVISLFLLVSCNGDDDYYMPEFYNVNLVLVTKDEKIPLRLDKKMWLEKVDRPETFSKFYSLLNGYVIENKYDGYYLDENMTIPAYFPLEMGEEDLNIYMRARPLENISNIEFIESDAIESYFSINGTLKDEFYLEPDPANESSFYEIVDKSSRIYQYYRYYPAIKKLNLERGYSITERIVSDIYVQDSFNALITIDFNKNEMKFYGTYSRVGQSSRITAGGFVHLDFVVNEISIDNMLDPLVPDFPTIQTYYQISNATNYNAMMDLWAEEGHNYAANCYGQFNTLLRTLSEMILIFK